MANILPACCAAVPNIVVVSLNVIEPGKIFCTKKRRQRQDAVLMISLVTLAHRVSNIYKRYASIHAALFSFSLAQLKIKFWRANEPAYCEFERKLMQFDQELMDVRAIINDEDQLESGNTVSREFAFALDVYIIALSDAIKCLSMICKRRCRELNGDEKYDIKQNWADRHDYDNKIQQYRRLGERLTDLFKRL